MKKIVSIIEDDADMGYIYSMMLSPYVDNGSLDLTYFSDSREFLKWFQDHKPDLILSDVTMPFVNGPDLCRLIKQSGKHIPTILVSGHDERDYRSVMEECCVKFLSKPLHFHDFLGLVESELGITAF